MHYFVRRCDFEAKLTYRDSALGAVFFYTEQSVALGDSERELSLSSCASEHRLFVVRKIYIYSLGKPDISA